MFLKTDANFTKVYFLHNSCSKIDSLGSVSSITMSIGPRSSILGLSLYVPLGLFKKKTCS